ncbi:hypothetical protein [Streptomyces sp. NPDC007905]|uniref:hypothetical protein n=1 Tax=Streptomyces sp. NPDC007905 TaxID=3364788 RepID=UPI0036E6FAA6
MSSPSPGDGVRQVDGRGTPRRAAAPRGARPGRPVPPDDRFGRRENTPGADADDEATARLRLLHRLSAAAADGWAETGFTTAVVQDVLLGERPTSSAGLIRTRPPYVAVLARRPLYVAVLARRPRTWPSWRAAPCTWPSWRAAPVRGRPGTRPEDVAAREAGRARTGYRTCTVRALDEELRLRTPRIGLWLDSSPGSPAKTVAAILAGAERAGVA